VEQHNAYAEKISERLLKLLKLLQPHCHHLLLFYSSHSLLGEKLEFAWPISCTV